MIRYRRAGRGPAPAQTPRQLGASHLGNGAWQFAVWAPTADEVNVHIIAPRERLIPMVKSARGYHQVKVENLEPGYLYMYRLDRDKERPDPASKFQPHGVHGPSQAIDAAFEWSDKQWHGLPLQQLIVYEAHVGTFTPEGTFEAIISHLDSLKDLGITALELMPVAQFPGTRNWGYDGVYPFATQDSYGGPPGLKRLVDACHQRGLAVVLDVVYNHLGPEGNYLRDYGPYFTDRYKTPWGAAINFDGPHSDEVRRYFIENALYWVTDFHIDALRLDAVHAIFDQSARPFLAELAEAVHGRSERLNRQIHLIAESDLNDPRLIRAPALGGYGLDAQWSDDLHHALHTLVTKEKSGYFEDFGEIDQLAQAIVDGYAFTGQYSPHRQRRHGSSTEHCEAYQFVVCSQNHDQVGNRMLGERLTHLVSFEALKLAASTVMLSPHVPLLFMGEEYGETAPFQYFISHLDSQLVEAVRRGRREEFSAFAWKGNPPDPQDTLTFERCKLNHQLRNEGTHRALYDFYRELIRFRKTVPAIALSNKERIDVASYQQEQVITIRRWNDDHEVILVLHFNDARTTVVVSIPKGRWQRVLDSAEERWNGSGTLAPEQLNSTGEARLEMSPWSVTAFRRVWEG